MSEIREEPESKKLPAWLEVTVLDVQGFDFERPIMDSIAADASDLSDIYRNAANIDEEVDSKAAIIWNLLQSLTGMNFKPEDANEPFGPMVVLPDGRRSAIPEDFRGHLDVLGSLAKATNNVVLRARLCDLVWLLDRRQWVHGVEAIKAYIELVTRIEAGELKFGSGDDDFPFHPNTRDVLLRALGLARLLGWDKPEAQSARDQLVAVRQRAVAARAAVPVHWYCELDLQMRISDPLTIAAEIESVLTDLTSAAGHLVAADLWRLAARAYQTSKKDEEKCRCQRAAAEVFVAQAEKSSSAMLASHLLSDAISMLHGVAGARERQLELKHQLIEVQARVSEEMTPLSHEMDLSDLVTAVEEKFLNLNVYDSLFMFAALDASPSPDNLRSDAIEQINQFPLSSLFSAAHLDDEGKVIHRTRGGGLSEADDAAIKQQIAQAEEIRRHITVSGQIDPARRVIVRKHYLSDDTFLALTSRSPFVAPDLAQTVARGLKRFFQGDFVCALYVLVPMLEDSLRHVLKSYGHDVTKFDSATQTQEDRSITSIFDGMRPELDAIFTRAISDEIERVFLDRPGPAIRHSVAHGLLHDGSPYTVDSIYACWLIFRLCVLPLYPYRSDLGLD